MPSYPFVTVDVFTDRRFGGNPLAVFPDAQGLSDADMQSLAAEFNLSETTFVLPPSDAKHSARVRIFNRTAEMPFAGHPMVGTGYALARQGRDRDGVLLFEVPAGVVRVEVARDASGAVTGGVITAPQPLSTGLAFPAETIAACAGLAPGDIRVDAHQPMVASMGNPFVLAEVADAALARALPDVQAFRDAARARPQLGGRLSLHLYVREPGRLRARMFAPLAGTFEDPATGSANTPLAGLLLSLTQEARREFEIVQGVEMGRPSLLRATAYRTPDGIRATIGGSCVPVLSGEATV
ncbi:MAG: PhzF family phenazine biosynthesis protein [Alphaproteobacteria bacterium]|nr:PhzF family phenazine biosynthesis protein [Alphaproteobacteria bacterium]